jgi:hypothetical protein
MLILPRQPHGPREPKLQRSVAEWTFDWINRYTLGGSGASKLASRPGTSGTTVATKAPGTQDP